ncbi:MAG: hypothetical protein RJB39_176 [Candidatus Parcubacteria bacterium]|jgi:hypothetical protein
MKFFTFFFIVVFALLLLLCAPQRSKLSSFRSFAEEGPGEAATVGFVHGMLSPFTGLASVVDPNYLVQQPSQSYRQPYMIGWVTGLLFFGLVVFYRDHPKTRTVEKEEEPTPIGVPIGLLMALEMMTRSAPTGSRSKSPATATTGNDVPAPTAASRGR